MSLATVSTSFGVFGCDMCSMDAVSETTLP